jgi:hypothetical protein
MPGDEVRTFGRAAAAGYAEGLVLACVRDMAVPSSTSTARERRAVSEPRPPGRRRELRWPLALAAVTLAGFALTAYFTSRITEWFVMTDEMQYVKLALGIASDGDLGPQIHGYSYRSLSQLYPLLLAPVVGPFDMPTAFRIGHYAGALIMASAAVPVYLLVRGLPAPRGAALVAAGLSVLVPYMAMALMLMSEVAAYPAFLWAVLAMHRGMSDPSPKRDLLAFAGIALAVSARTQFVVLAIAYPAAVVLHEAGYALARRRGHGEALRDAIRDAGRRHVVLWIAASVAVVAVAGLAAAGELELLLGSYAATTEGDLLPPGVVRSAIYHADLVFVAGGVIPAVLGLGWALSSIVLPSRRSLHAYAVLLLVVGAGLLLQVASFDLRFVHGLLQTRYLAPLAPMLIAAAVACCLDERRRWIGALVAAAALSRVLPWLPYTPAPSPWFSAPDTAFHVVLHGRTLEAGRLVGLDGVEVADVLRWGTPVLGIALALLLRAVAGRAALAAVTAVLLPFGVVQTGYVLDKMSSEPNGARTVTGGTLEGRDWIDRAVPDGASVAIIPVPIADAPVPPDDAAYFSQTLWWDTEFWNKSVEQAYGTSGIDSFTDWPKPTLRVDRAAGRLIVDDRKPYVVVSSSQMGFRLEARRVLAATGIQELLEVPLSYELEWATESVSETGAVGREWSIRVYGDAGRATRRRVGFDLPAALPPRVRLVLRSGDTRTTVTGAGRPRLEVCIPAAGHIDVDVELRGAPSAQLERIVAGPVTTPGAC